MPEIMNYLDKATSMVVDQPIIMIIMLNVFMIIASYTDIKSMKIYNKFNLIMFGTRILSMIVMLITNKMNTADVLWYVAGAVVMFLAFLIPAMISMDSIGGDIKFAFNVGLYTGLHAGLLIACIASITNFLFRIFFVGKEKKEPFFKVFMHVPIFINAKRVLPLGPFFYLGYLILFAIRFIFV